MVQAARTMYQVSSQPNAYLICLGSAFMKLAAAHPEPSTTTRGLSSLTASCTEDMEGMSV